MGTKKSMDTKKNSKPATGACASDVEFEADVLFQRIYNQWYAFTVVEEDCLVAQVSEEEVTKRLSTMTEGTARMPSTKKTPRES